MTDTTPLPTPSPVFCWSREAWGPALRCEPLGAVAQHVFTTRQLPLRAAAPNDGAWSQALQSVGAEAAALRRVTQVHGRAVHVIRAGEHEAADPSARPSADAIVSNVPGLALAVLVADCVPVLMADPRTGAAAAVHAGWRGTCAAIVPAAVNALAREFGSRPQDLVAAVGPSIGPCCYDVGGELVDAFRARPYEPEAIARWFARQDGVLRLDLWTATCDQLRAAGLAADRIHLARLCTRTHSAVFDSYRAAGAAAGRSAAIIAVPGA